MFSWNAALDLWLLADIVALGITAVITATLFAARAHTSFVLVSLLWVGSFAAFAWNRRSSVLGSNRTSATRGHLADWFKAALLVLAWCYATRQSQALPEIWGLTTFGVGICVLCITGIAARTIIFWLSEAGALGTRIAIYGCGEGTKELLDYIAADRGPAAHVERLFDERIGRGEGPINGYEITQDFEELVAAANSHAIDAVMLNLPWSASDRINQLVHRLERVNVDIIMAPSPVQVLTRSRSIGFVGSIPTVSIYRQPMRGLEAAAKVVMDRVLALAGLILLTPFLIPICLLIKLESPGPVLFRQKRRGMNNQPFEMLKFRSMHISPQDGDAPRLVTRNDPRVTRVGAILRRTSLDELPQLVNVLIGNMSLVGPRPHLWEAKAADRRYEEIVKRYPARHRVLPGITGLAQVRGYRGNGDDENEIINRVQSDLEYIDRWSLALDIGILTRTVLTVLLQKGAY